MKKGDSKKLHPIRKGPFLITAELSPGVYTVAGRRKESVVHHDRLSFSRAEMPLWLRRKRHFLLHGKKSAEIEPEKQPGLLEGDLPALFQPQELPDTSTANTLETPGDHVIPVSVPSVDLEPVESTVDISGEPIPVYQPLPQRTRRGRAVRCPSKYTDYDLS